MTDKPKDPGTEVAVAEDASTSMIQVIERAALNPDVDIEKMERLLNMQERIIDKQAKQEFNIAMSEAQSKMGQVSTDATNPQTKSKYASYSALDKALRPIYTAHGFALSFDGGDSPQEKYVRVRCEVSHKGGFSKNHHVDMPADGKGAKGGDVMTLTHAAGAAFTYGQRYLLKLIFNVAIGENDDDGNSAGAVISEKQKDDILRLLKQTGVDTLRLLTYMSKVCKREIKSVDDIPAGKFGIAISGINSTAEHG